MIWRARALMTWTSVAGAVLAASSARATDLTGPGRFCGYSPIIDLLAGERITTLQGGIHGGSFRWKGPFGELEVDGIGWASPPSRFKPLRRTTKGLRLFRQRHEVGHYVVALWNGRQGAAYFTSPAPITPGQWAAIERVDLFQEGENPTGCKLRTVFSWEPIE